MPTRAEVQTLLKAGELAKSVAEVLEAEGQDIEETWVLLALAANVAERAVIEADRACDDLKAYAAAQSRIAHLKQISDRMSEVVEADFAREDGSSEPIRS